MSASTRDSELSMSRKSGAIAAKNAYRRSSAYSCFFTIITPPMRAAPPATSVMFAIFEPMAFPSEIVGKPVKADVTPTNSSGKLVARPTINEVKKNPPIRDLFAKDLRCDDKRLDDLMRISEKTIIPMIWIYGIRFSIAYEIKPSKASCESGLRPDISSFISFDFALSKTPSAHIYLPFIS